MSKIIAICGKICSGKTYYANNLKEKENAVILSTDEITSRFFNNDLKEQHDEMCLKINDYLLDKAIEIVKTGSNVILDWGFWKKSDRENIKKYCNDNDIIIEFHYINISDEKWHKQINERNKNVINKLDNSYYVDEELLQKMTLFFEEPSVEEIDVWYDN